MSRQIELVDAIRQSRLVAELIDLIEHHQLLRQAGRRSGAARGPTHGLELLQQRHLRGRDLLKHRRPHRADARALDESAASVGGGEVQFERAGGRHDGDATLRRREHGRRARFAQVRAGAGIRQARRLQQTQILEQRVGAVVDAVVVGDRHHAHAHVLDVPRRHGVLREHRARFVDRESLRLAGERGAFLIREREIGAAHDAQHVVEFRERELRDRPAPARCRRAPRT